MNTTNENQHYISKVLLNRFRIPGQPLQCYQIKSGTWKPRSVERLCSREGYHQLLVPGEQTNNALEASLSRVESLLPKTFKSLEFAATQEVTDLPAPIYKNLRDYCTFLKLSSLFSKASAVVSFLTQLNMELERREYFLWHELSVTPDVIAGFRAEYLAGGRVIIESENVAQLIYRLQFERLLNANFYEMLHTDWTVAVSPIDLPLSDIGIVQVHLESLKANHYLLPIGPQLLLEGIWYHDASKNSLRTSIKGVKMTTEEAEYRLGCICLSSVREIIWPSINESLGTILARSEKSGVRFARITNPDLVLTAGKKNASRQYSLRCVSQSDYKKLLHSYVMPPAT